eukprot:CAMPEP_0116878420 /NCGR_PEP_ID=MMETSP0463-20121206/10183_1 /TAXON_ID=181622 /ORGANISM="Strombidinopsis sp, Strain SopsisLIS2011" /LENGTH=95 /DNA_ID=CAMNT_0004526649 /DNA_START=34 /DNA_END=321 /DNA_ORIENTATION=-
MGMKDNIQARSPSMTVIQGGVCDLVVGLIFLGVYGWGAFGGGAWSCWAPKTLLTEPDIPNFGSSIAPMSPDCEYISTNCYIEGVSDPAEKSEFAI